MFEAIKEDIKRFVSPEEASWRTIIAGILSPGFQAILVYRFFNWCYRHRIPAQPFRYLVERFTEITTGISIPACCKIGKGLRIHHFGGVILHPSVEMGEHCTIYHQVTIGDCGGYGGAAKIGNDVIIGAGAKIIKEIEIGDRCIIGANAVVAKSMPSDTVAYGNPVTYKPKDNAGNGY
jgi:serine O-acetyltransferase